MLKIPNKISITISIAFSIAFFIVCVILAFLMPVFATFKSRELSELAIVHMGAADIYILLALAYVGLAIVIFTDILLFRLLLRVRAGKVFTAESVSLIRGISWGCYLVGAVFGAVSMYFVMVGLMLAFVAGFLGLCLRVVKNVIEEATEIKAENDMTV